MSGGHYAEAWPYAEAAARTWAGWAMTCAQNCAEGLENWKAAEGYARASTERYPQSMWAVWFLFCERTGHGDIAAARAWTREFATGLLENPQLSVDNLLLVSYVQLLCGDKDKAAGALCRIPGDTSEQVYISSVAAVAELAGAADVRDAALEHFCTSFQKSSARAVRIFQLIRDANAARKPMALDLRAVDEILGKVPKVAPGPVGFRDCRAPDGERAAPTRRSVTGSWYRTVAIPMYGGASSPSRRSAIATQKKPPRRNCHPRSDLI